MSLEVFEQLSPREQKVLFAIMNGATAQEICKQDFVSLSTVRSQIHSIFSKLGVSTQLAAVILAYRSGWVPEISGVKHPRRETEALRIGPSASKPQNVARVHR
ncbi:MAG: helix-turn-helix transcriptional regulator [Acidimicrobiales bacterium]